MNIPGVKAPSYASGENTSYCDEIGGTVSEHERGRGYTLQLSGGGMLRFVVPKGGITLLVTPTAEMPAKDYDNDKAIKITLSMP